MSDFSAKFNLFTQIIVTMSEVLVNTVLVILLSIVTTVLLHLLLLRYSKVNIQEGFISGQNVHHVTTAQNVRYIPYDTFAHNTIETQKGTTTYNPNSFQAKKVHTNASDDEQHIHATSKHKTSLEDELKKWMQQESMNWATTSASKLTGRTLAESASDKKTSSHEITQSDSKHSNDKHKMSTSIEQVFQDQQVNTNDVKPPNYISQMDKSNSLHGESTDTSSTKTSLTSVSYCNTMNSGDLGGGLSAYDNSSSHYANI